VISGLVASTGAVASSVATTVASLAMEWCI
jgi:hypothetical protein